MHMHVHAEPNEKMRLREATAIIVAGGVTNGILGVVKIVLGGVTGYLPLTASGVHSLSDIVSDSGSFWGQKRRYGKKWTDWCGGKMMPRKKRLRIRGPLTGR